MTSYELYQDMKKLLNIYTNDINRKRIDENDVVLHNLEKVLHNPLDEVTKTINALANCKNAKIALLLYMTKYTPINRFYSVHGLRIRFPGEKDALENVIQQFEEDSCIIDSVIAHLQEGKTYDQQKPIVSEKSWKYGRAIMQLIELLIMDIHQMIDSITKDVPRIYTRHNTINDMDILLTTLEDKVYARWYAINKAKPYLSRINIPDALHVIDSVSGICAKRIDINKITHALEWNDTTTSIDTIIEESTQLEEKYLYALLYVIVTGYVGHTKTTLSDIEAKVDAFSNMAYDTLYSENMLLAGNINIHNANIFQCEPRDVKINFNDYRCLVDTLARLVRKIRAKEITSYQDEVNYYTSVSDNIPVEDVVNLIECITELVYRRNEAMIATNSILEYNEVISLIEELYRLRCDIPDYYDSYTELY